MTVKEQLHDRLWATTKDYEEVKPYLNKPGYDVQNTFHANGLFDMYYISLI